MFASSLSRRAIVCAAAALIVLPAAAGTASAAPALPDGCTLGTARVVTCTYASTGAEQTFAVPDGVASIDVHATGGHGGQYPGIASGGAAGAVEVDGLAVTPGATLYVEVGGVGVPAPCGGRQTPGGWNGGGAGGDDAWGMNCTNKRINPSPGFSGGGATDLRTTARGSGVPLTGDPATDPRLLVAAGGGGAAHAVQQAGGAGGVPSADPLANGAGTDGATLQGICNGTTEQCHYGGYGATLTAAGAGGQLAAGPGAAGQGGGGQLVDLNGGFYYSGGGGGGGWFGGGGGGSEGAAGGIGAGGGGSDMVPAGGTVLAQTLDDPGMTITYALPADVTAPSVTITSPADGASFVAGTAVTADYACEDDDTGVATCAGPVADGAAVDTTAPGTHAFTVNATDAAGNRTTKTVHYSVTAAPDTGTGTTDTSTGTTTSTTTSTPPPAPVAGAGTTPPPVPMPPRAAFSRGSTAKVAPSKTSLIHVAGVTATCPTGGGSCRIAERLVLTIRRAGHRTQKVTLTHAATVATGTATRLLVRLPASIRHLLGHGTTITASATLTATNTGGTTTTTRTFGITARR
ncbi:glycine-rich protein [Conexibacter woesei]|uniref:glycine-rich protein n=1 Tax=Conexibacter woesei TaxID=191495 RepID=UPI00042959BD|nr:glycine-rich protein [Conexibacter woesei]